MIVLSKKLSTDEIRAAVVKAIRDYNSIDGAPSETSIPENIDTMTREELMSWAFQEEWVEWKEDDEAEMAMLENRQPS